MADQVTSVDLPPMDGEDRDDAPKVETDTRPEDAPWGYKEDGTPYKVDPARYRRRDANRRRASSGPQAKKTKAKAGSPYRDSVLGLVQIVGLPLAAAGARDDRFLADLVALNATAPGIADAVDSIAQNNRQVAAALDKLGEVGPYGLLIGALAPLILQVACNHGIVPAGTMGTIAADDLLQAAAEGQIPGMDGMAA
jgi:hypothetical protein